MKRGDLSFARNFLSSRMLLGTLTACIMLSLSAWAAPQGGSEVPPDATPQIQQINPSQAAPGAHISVVIQGSNFSAGAYVSSISPAIHVDSCKRVSATQLEAQLSVGANATLSTVSLLVSNPASRAAETAFKIVAGRIRRPPRSPHRTLLRLRPRRLQQTSSRRRRPHPRFTWRPRLHLRLLPLPPPCSGGTGGGCGHPPARRPGI